MSPSEEKNALICITCKKQMLVFYEFKLMTEERQREGKYGIKKEFNVHFVDDPMNIDENVIKNEIESVNIPNDVDVAIKDELLNEEDRIGEPTEMSFLDTEKEDSFDESFNSESDFNEDQSESIEKNDRRKVPSHKIQQIEVEEGVIKTVVDNVEFVTRKPGCLIMIEKKKKNAIRNNQKPENWIRIKQRTARAKGEEYRSRQGKIIRARKLQPPCDSKCRFNCAEKISENDRQRSFDTYWQLADFIKQRKYLYEHSKADPIARRRGRKEHGVRRKFSLKFFLDVYKQDGSVKEQIKVCAKMFVNTFDICNNILRTLHKKIITTGKVEDLRGQNRRQPSPGHLAAIAHVKSFPFFHIEKPMPLTQLYKLYEQECREKQVDPIKEHTYRKIFSDNNECDFLKQDRMICDVCDNYYKINEQEQATMRVTYEQHIRSNEKCMQRARWRMSGRRKAERRKLLREQQKAQQIHSKSEDFESEINFL